MIGVIHPYTSLVTESKRRCHQRRKQRKKRWLETHIPGHQAVLLTKCGPGSVVVASIQVNPSQSTIHYVQSCGQYIGHYVALAAGCVTATSTDDNDNDQQLHINIWRSPSFSYKPTLVSLGSALVAVVRDSDENSPQRKWRQTICLFVCFLFFFVIVEGKKHWVNETIRQKFVATNPQHQNLANYETMTVTWHCFLGTIVSSFVFRYFCSWPVTWLT